VSGGIPRPDDARALADLRRALAGAGYTTEAIEDRLGGGRLASSPADIALHLRRLSDGDPFSALARLFLLGLPLSESEAESVLGGERLRSLRAAGWLEGDRAVQASIKLVPHGDLLVASDLDADGPTGPDWVAGMHPPSVTLAKLTVRRRIGRALDVATGNGIQALLASRHADAVIATDVNVRALAVAALNAALNGVENVELREGSFFEPVARERFDLLTCNPPYVISPESRFAFRDSGLPGDTVSREVVRAAPRHLADGGLAHILVSWAHPPGEPWGPVEAWVEESGCDALLLHFGSDDPITHAGEWLRPVAAQSVERFRESLTEWLDYLERIGIEAIAHGAVILRRRPGRNWVRRETIPLDRLEQASDDLPRLFASQDYLESLEDGRALLDSAFALVERHHLEQTLTYSDGEAEIDGTVLWLDEGLGFRIALDEHTTRLLPRLDGRRPLREVLAAQSEELGLEHADAVRFESAALPVVRRLVELGYLAPV